MRARPGSTLAALPAVLAALVLLLAGCGERTVVDSPAPATGATEQPEGYEVELVEPDVDDPPPVVLRLADGTSHDLAPWTYCLDGGCADGSWPEHPFDVGRPAWVDVTFGVPDWTFEATFTSPRRLSATPREARSWRSVQGRVEPIGRHTFRVRPAGPAGDWHVDLFGRGPDGGDVIVTFAWTTTADGDYPDAATGQAAVLAGNDGELTSYGVELGLRDLDRTPASATASIEVTADDGRSTTLDLGRPDEAWQAGTVSWRAPERLGLRAAALGGSRFTYTVRVVLDGTTYTGTGVWPDDTDEDITPAVPLTFTPPLPVYAP